MRSNSHMLIALAHALAVEQLIEHLKLTHLTEDARREIAGLLIQGSAHVLPWMADKLHAAAEAILTDGNYKVSVFAAPMLIKAAAVSSEPEKAIPRMVRACALCVCVCVCLCVSVCVCVYVCLCVLCVCFACVCVCALRVCADACLSVCLSCLLGHFSRL